MVKVTLTAHPEHWLAKPGRSSAARVFLIGAAPLGRREAVCANVAAITSEVATFGAQIAESNPEQSFAVNVRVAKGERKPPGFDKADFGAEKWMRTYNRAESNALLCA